MGLMNNLKKAFKKPHSNINSRVKGFPSIIDEQVKPVDVAKEKDNHDLPKENNTLDLPKERSLDLPTLNIVKHPAKNDIDTTSDNKESIKLDTKDSFFLNLYNQVNAGKVSESDFVNENILLKMKDYWKNDSSVIQNQSENEQRKSKLRDMLNEALKELTGLEDKWRSLRIEQERINFMVKQVESDVDAEGLRFKELVKKLKFHEDVVPDKPLNCLMVEK